jgi:predicted dehydrogenase
MSQSEDMKRRQFINTASTLAAITIVPRHVLGGPKMIPPSDKINIGYIGTGTQGIRNLMQALPKPEIQIISVCDVNRDSYDYIEWSKNELRNKIRKFLEQPQWGAGISGCRAGREVGREIVETFYGKNKPSNKYSGCTTYVDFRELLEKEKDLDAVYIMTPEHLHATIAIAAMKKGKHVIMHKPLANVLSEVGKVTEVARSTKVATHMFCSADTETTPLLCEWIWDGAIGEVREIHNWSTRPFWPQGMPNYPSKTVSIPPGFDWDLWLGPVPYRPYHPSYTHAVFRGWYDFGTGTLGDMGHYSFYQLFKILKLVPPVSVEASRSQYWTIQDGYWTSLENVVSYPKVSTVHFEFPSRSNMPECTLHWYDGNIKPPKPAELDLDNRDMPDEGLLFVGDRGKILADFSGGSPRIIPEKRMKEYTRPPKTLPRPIDELDQWIGACKGGNPSDANFEAVSPISETISLGTIAQRIAKKIMWDTQSKKISSPSEANEFMYRKYRKGWELV